MSALIMTDLKVLHVHHAMYLPVTYVRELRKRNIKSDSVYFSNQNQTWQTDNPDYNFGVISYQNFHKLYSFLLFLVKKAIQYNVIHFHSEPGFFINNYIGRMNNFLGMPDLKYLKKNGARIVYSHWGCHEGSLPSHFLKQNNGKACINCKTGTLSKFCTDKIVKNICETQLKFGDNIINGDPDFSS